MERNFPSTKLCDMFGSTEEIISDRGSNKDIIRLTKLNPQTRNFSYISGFILLNNIIYFILLFIIDLYFLNYHLVNL